ncbi:hypothetical protein MTQ01_20640 [Streptomyces sp. XM4193]|uniref:hypothetical protein n=1 Tax=Streptomyces sp. XM4193 TaxID=2929782 RepID=UPI001FF77790|nr:hypothetical protein [Streptomyces sp. XM4193]MCK1798390.1 hypothetical protein [Streptomyces sp. XM4193]
MEEEDRADRSELDALGAALRSEADGVRAGTPPVEAVLRRGRSRRARRRAAACGAVFAVATIAMALTAGPRLLTSEPAPPPSATSTADDGDGDDSGRDERGADTDRPDSGDAKPPTPVAPTVVQPDEAYPVPGGGRLALLSTGAQNYLLEPGQIDEEEFAGRLDARRSPAIGDNIRPDSMSGSSAGSTGRMWGAWRHEGPLTITVDIGGEEFPAELYSLPGRPGWGVYHVDTGLGEGVDSYTVTARDADGEVFDVMTSGPPPPDGERQP